MYNTCCIVANLSMNTYSKLFTFVLFSLKMYSKLNAGSYIMRQNGSRQKTSSVYTLMISNNACEI